MFTSHSDLGMVVAAIRREFEKSCPSVQPNTSPINVEYQPGVEDKIKLKLSQMEKEDLQDILGDDGALEKFVSEISYPPLETTLDNITSMEDNIRAQAENNTKLQQEIELLKDSLLNKVQDYHSKKADVEVLYKKCTDLKQRVSSEVMADKLIRLSVSNEEESDKIAEQFLSRELSVDDFLQDYIKIRTDCHLQKLKADKVKRLH